MERNKCWGVGLCADADVLLSGQLVWLSLEIAFWKILLSIILVAALISSLRYLNMPGVVFASAFLAMLYAKPLGITALVPWTLLGAAVLLSIGLSLVIHPTYTRAYRYHWHAQARRHHHNHHYESEDTVSENHVTMNLSFGNSIRYVHSSQFETADLRVSMAGAKIYFDDVTLAQPEATIQIDLSLGSLELYVPRTWQVQFELNNNMGHIDISGQPTPAGPVVKLTGDVSLGDLNVIYI